MWQGKYLHLDRTKTKRSATPAASTSDPRLHEFQKDLTTISHDRESSLSRVHLMNLPHSNEEYRGIRHVRTRGGPQNPSNHAHFQQQRGPQQHVNTHYDHKDAFDENVPFISDHKPRTKQSRPRQGLPWQPSLEDLHENVRPSPPRGRSNRPVDGRGLARPGPLPRPRNHNEKPSLRHGQLPPITPARPPPARQAPRPRATEQKEKRRPISSWFVTKSPLDGKQFNVSAPPFANPPFAAPFYSGTTAQLSQPQRPEVSRLTTTTSSTIDRSRLPTAPMDHAPRSCFYDGPEEKEKEKEKKYVLEISGVSDSIARTRRSRRRKRRLDAVGIVFSLLLLIGTIGAYVYYLYKSRFWVDDVEAERQHRPKLDLPHWAHGVAVGGIIASLIAVIAFCTHRKHA